MGEIYIASKKVFITLTKGKQTLQSKLPLFNATKAYRDTLEAPFVSREVFSVDYATACYATYFKSSTLPSRLSPLKLSEDPSSSRKELNVSRSLAERKII